MKKLILPAPAKLNLFLHINSQRDDGLHELQTIFQLLSYGDSLSFTLRNDKAINLNSRIPGVSTENNLVMRAAKLMQQHDKKRRGVDIVLTKRLPLGSGLGGGSSDAATTLHALNDLWEIDMPISMLLKLGLQLGADVPVFVQGQSCWAEGVGELITPMTLPEPWFVVISPQVSISTAEIFFDKQLTRDTPKQTMSSSLIETGENNCQAVVLQRYPEVAEALNWLNRFGTAQMTGTGGCVFARFIDKDEAQAVLDELPKNYKGFIAQGLNQSPLLTSLGTNR
jgi:4-diphosphocytidyl-2-C-methyl-D-erythritol kinase